MQNVKRIILRSNWGSYFKNIVKRNRGRIFDYEIFNLKLKVLVFTQIENRAKYHAVLAVKQ